MGGGCRVGHQNRTREKLFRVDSAMPPGCPIKAKLAHYGRQAIEPGDVPKGSRNATVEVTFVPEAKAGKPQGWQMSFCRELAVPLVFGEPANITVLTTFLYQNGLGASRPDQLRDNAAASGLELDAETLRAIETV